MSIPNQYAWFAVNAKMQREKYVSNILRLKGYEVFLPLHRVRRRWSDRMKEIENPLFPGYIFCRFDPNEKLPILVVPGVLSIVGIGKAPLPVDENEINAIRTVVESGLPVQALPHFEVGYAVRIECGPLQGVEGIITDYNHDKKKLIVSITLLRRSVAVTIDASWVRTIKVSAKSA
jgi:transcription antitermination factor NusG